MKKFLAIGVALCMALTLPLSVLASDEFVFHADESSPDTIDQTFQISQRGEVMNVDGVVMLDQSQEVFELINMHRKSAGLATLTASDSLQAAARQRAAEISLVFAHVRPDFSAWSTVSALAKGENLAFGQMDANEAFLDWMGSLSHKQNIAKASFGSMGTACVSIGGTKYWAVVFGE